MSKYLKVLAIVVALGVALAIPAAAFGWPPYVPGVLVGVAAGLLGALALRRSSADS